MSYSDLPEDWPERSLSEPDIARDVLDLCVTDADRHRGGVSVLLCGPGGRLRQPVFLDGVPADPDPSERRATMDWATHACQPLPDARDQRPGSLLLALVRAEGGVCDDDRFWHQVALDACAGAGVELLGTYVVTLGGVHTLPTARRAA